MGKIDVHHVFLDYVRTLHGVGDSKLLPFDIVLHIGFPVALVPVMLFLFPDVLVGLMSSSGDAVTVVTIVSSFMYGVSVMVFQMRLDMDSGPGSCVSSQDAMLADELFADVLWSVLAGFMSAALMLVAGSSHDPNLLQMALAAVGTALMANFALVSLMCVKRLSALYSVVSRQWPRRRARRAADREDGAAPQQ